ncbi:uncharacterized protein LOC135468589 [Liolophura sinensis]|uniref:uncharacterized protein LOC135468589 n=1 Tax=Liolophura sinensis TaxID=3198878 RepID=UPI0031585FBE
MSTLWQKFRNSSGALPNLSFVTNIFNRNNYRDLEGDNVEENKSENQDEDGVSSDGFDEVDAGIVARRKYIDLLRESENDEPVIDWQGKGDDLWRENNRNELIETKAKDDQPTESKPGQVQLELNESQTQPTQNELNKIHNDRVEIGQEHSNDTLDNFPRTGDLANDLSHVKDTSCQPSSEPCDEPISFRRSRRDSYDKALAEMRDSYDRVFGDIVDEPPVISTSHDVWVKRSTGVENGLGSQSCDVQDSVSRKPFHRQISLTIQQEIPSAISVIRQRSYSKLGEDPDEIVHITDTLESTPSEWHSSFPVQEKKKHRKRSKKVWKKTKKAARVSWKWLKRSFIAYASSYHHGIPMTVAMYGGSRHQGRPKFYDYR